AWSPPQPDARLLLDALERADRQVARVHRDRHQTCLRQVAVLRVRALRTHEKPAVGLQGRHRFACGHAPVIISFTLCPVNALAAADSSIQGNVTKGADDGTVPIPEPLRPYIDAAIKLSPS